MKTKHLLKTHITILAYAELMQVYPSRVYEAIKKGAIKADLVGLSEIKMLDLKIYGTYQFNKKNVDEQTVKDWFERKGRKRNETR
jgi:hypothetical protein